MTDRWVTVKQLSRAYPCFSESSLRSLIFNRQSNGIGFCLRRIGSRLLINTEEFEKWVDRQKVIETKEVFFYETMNGKKKYMDGSRRDLEFLIIKALLGEPTMAIKHIFGIEDENGNDSMSNIADFLLSHDNYDTYGEIIKIIASHIIDAHKKYKNFTIGTVLESIRDNEDGFFSRTINSFVAAKEKIWVDDAYFSYLIETLAEFDLDDVEMAYGSKYDDSTIRKVADIK